MTNPSLVLRGGPSGPTFAPSTPGYVLTIDADGKSVVPMAGGGGGVSSVFARTGAVVAVAGDYDASEVTNDSSVTGVSVKDALDHLIALASVPKFSPPQDNGSVNGAFALDFSTNLYQQFTLTGNTTLTVVGLAAGASQWPQMRVIQGAGGPWTLTVPAAKTPGGAGLTLSTATGARDLVSGSWDGFELDLVVGGLGFA